MSALDLLIAPLLSLHLNVADIDCKKFPLHCAVVDDNATLVTKLIDYGFDVNQLEDKQRAPLHLSVNLETADILKLLLSRGAQVDMRTGEGEASLHLAVVANKTVHAEALLDHQANINITNKKGATPLMLVAAWDKDLHLFRRVLDLGADIQAKDILGRDLSHYAVSSPERLRLLTAKGKNHNGQDQAGQSPLHLCGSSHEPLACAETLVELGAVVDPQDRQGDTPLHLAAAAGQTSVVSFLVSKQARLDKTNTKGRTAFMAAIAAKQLPTAEQLQVLGTNVNAADLENKTALFFATENDDQSAAQKLLEYGLEINHRSHQGTVLALAINKGHAGLAAFLVQRGGKVSADIRDQPLNLAIEVGKHEVLRALLGAGVSPDTEERSSNSAPVHKAIQKKDLKSLAILLDAGANPNLIYQRDKYRPLEMAFKGQFLAGFQLLVQKNAEVNFLMAGGTHQLIHAVVNDRDTEYLEALIQNKTLQINVLSEGSQCQSALHIAAGIYNYKLAEKMIPLLLKAGADVNLKDCAQQTPYLIASTEQTQKVLQDMEAAGADLTIKDPAGRPLMWYVVEKEWRWAEASYIERLIAGSPASINDQDGSGNTFGHFLASQEKETNVYEDLQQREKILAVLAKAGADFDLQNQDGNTVLHLNCHSKSVLQHIKNINATNKVGATALHSCLSSTKLQVDRYLVKSYQTQGADLSLIDDLGNTVIHAAALGNHGDAVRYMTEDPALPKVDTLNKNRETALHLAATLGRTKATLALLEKKADRSRRDSAGKTALERAKEQAKHWTVAVLTHYPKLDEVDRSLPDDSADLQWGFEEARSIDVLPTGELRIASPWWMVSTTQDVALQWWRTSGLEGNAPSQIFDDKARSSRLTAQPDYNRNWADGTLSHFFSDGLIRRIFHLGPFLYNRDRGEFYATLIHLSGNDDLVVGVGYDSGEDKCEGKYPLVATRLSRLVEGQEQAVLWSKHLPICVPGGKAPVVIARANGGFHIFDQEFLWVFSNDGKLLKKYEADKMNTHWWSTPQVISLASGFIVYHHGAAAHWNGQGKLIWGQEDGRGNFLASDHWQSERGFFLSIDARGAWVSLYKVSHADGSILTTKSLQIEGMADIKAASLDQDGSIYLTGTKSNSHQVMVAKLSKDFEVLLVKPLKVAGN